MSNSDSQSAVDLVVPDEIEPTEKPKFLVGDSEISDTEEAEVEDQQSNSNMDSPNFPLSLASEDVPKSSNMALPERGSSPTLAVESEPAGSVSPTKQLQDEEVPIQLSRSEGELSQKSKSGKTSARGVDLSVAHLPVQPSDIIEYEWPLKSGERYFIQEQICLMLDINSFKRKYPELTRRTVEPKERDYLIKELGFITTLSSTSLTALQAVEVHDLISTEHPHIYAAYQKACAEKVKRAMMEKQKELELIKLDAKKMEELRLKAIKSASEYNGELQLLKRSERQQFWDIQTNIVQSPANKWLRMAPEYTHPSNYPVFLIPGQYTENFRKFDAAALRRLPLGTVMENDDLFPPRRDPSPPPIRVSEAEKEKLQRREREESAAMADNEDSLMEKPPPTTSFKLIKQELLDESMDSPSPIIKKPRRNSSDAPPAKMRKMSASVSRKNPRSPAVAPSPKQLLNPSSGPNCSICQSQQPPVNTATPPHAFVRCSACQNQMHSCCVDMPPAMVEVALKYDWCCIECKTCSICAQPDQEAAMMCCDLCDRGYHTFCIGLSKPPNGIWHCVKCNSSSSSSVEVSPSVKIAIKSDPKV